MVRINKLKLTQLCKAELEARQMNALKGGDSVFPKVNCRLVIASDSEAIQLSVKWITSSFLLPTTQQINFSIAVVIVHVDVNYYDSGESSSCDNDYANHAGGYTSYGGSNGSCECWKETNACILHDF